MQAVRHASAARLDEALAKARVGNCNSGFAGRKRNAYICAFDGRLDDRHQSARAELRRKAAHFRLNANDQLLSWATAKVADAPDDSGLGTALTVESYDAKVERTIVLTVQAYDWNCPQHIVPRYTTTEIAHEISQLNPDVVNPCGAEPTD